jgi:hypothetical protein
MKKNIVKQMGRGVQITQMEEALVLWEYGMEVTSHKDFISYGK